MQFGTRPGPEVPYEKVSGCWVKLRKLDWAEDDRYEELVGLRAEAEAQRHMVACMVAEFRLPDPDDPSKRAISRPVGEAGAAADNAAMLTWVGADKDVRTWLIRECLRAKGDESALGFLELADQATAESRRRIADFIREERERQRDEARDLVAEQQAAEERRRGNSGASPERSGEAEPDS